MEPSKSEMPLLATERISPLALFRFREDQKRRIEGAAHKAGGKRNWAQVLCNGGIATELAILYLIDVGSSGMMKLDLELVL